MIAVPIGLLFAAASYAAAPVTYDFEAEDATTGWTVTGPSAALSVTQEAGMARQGQSALLCSFTGQPGQPFSVSRAELDVAGARSLRLALRASAQAPLVLTLAEEDGSVYQTFATCIPNEWCDLALPLTDFQLQDGSQDENAALDADHIRTLTIQDLSNMPGELGEIFGTRTGAQTLVVDAVTFAADPVPSRSQTANDKVVTDTFEGSALYVLPVGGAELSHVRGHEGNDPSAIGVRFPFYPTGARAWPGVVIPIGNLDLSDTLALRLRVKPTGPVRLHVLLEEQDGSRYESSGAITAADEWQARDFRLAEFTLDPSREDENGLLDTDQLRVLVIVADAFNVLLDETAAGQFAIDDALFLKP
jgi:hypothetical protein